MYSAIVKAFDAKTMEFLGEERVHFEADDRDDAKFWLNHALTCERPGTVLQPLYNTVRREKDAKPLRGGRP